MNILKKLLIPIVIVSSLNAQSYKQCLDDAYSTRDMANCTTEEKDKEDKRLNRNYKNLKMVLTEEKLTELLTAQRLWIKFRDSNCSFYFDPDGGSIGGTLDYSDCLLEMTKLRANELEALRKKYSYE